MFRVYFFAGKHFQYFRTITYNVYEIMCMSSISFMCLFFSPSKKETNGALWWPLVFCLRWSLWGFPHRSTTRLRRPPSRRLFKLMESAILWLLCFCFGNIDSRLIKRKKERKKERQMMMKYCIGWMGVAMSRLRSSLRSVIPSYSIEDLDLVELPNLYVSLYTHIYIYE